MKAAVFDLDNTLIEGTSGEIFSRFLRREGVLSFTSLSGIYLDTFLYSLGIKGFERVVERGIRVLRGKRAEVLSLLARRCVREILEERVVEEVHREFEMHRKRGDEMAIASGSSSFIVEAFGEFLALPRENILSVSSILSKGEVMGKSQGPLCYSEGKLKMIRGWLRGKGIALQDTHFYSDNLSDVPVFERVGHPVVVAPSPRLGKFAARQGWRILHLESGRRRRTTFFDYISKRSR